MAKMYGKGKTAIESEDQQRLRWQVELEFVQCLANPNYLNFLAQRGYFKDQTFINYLKYLQYWKEPEYAKYLMYPMCLYFLDLLQYEHFRREIVNSQCCKFIDDQAILQWQHYTRKRMKLLNSVNNMGQINPNESNDQQMQQQGSNPNNMQNGIVNNIVTPTQQSQQQQAQHQNPQAQQQINGVVNAGIVGPMAQKMQ